VFPFLALLAGLGAASRAALRPWAPVLLGLALAEPALAIVRLHPYQASYYNALVGGLPGAERRGLEMSLMKEALNREVYADLNRLLPAGASLEGGPFLYEDLLFAQGSGWLRADVEVRWDAPADYVLIVNRRGWFRPADSALFDFARPAYAVSADGVRLVALYRMR